MPLTVEARVEVRIDPARDLHGPCVVRTANGGWLLCHQDSQVHHGGDGYVHQWRSVDAGASWQDEGAAADWRPRGLDSLFGEYVLAPDGALVMFVQRRQPRSGNEGILGAWSCRSDDDGHSWSEVGPVDDSDEHAVMSVRSPVTRGGTMYAGGWGRQGNALYVSDDDGRTWQRRSVIFPPTCPGFESLRQAGPPFYPHVEFCPDGSLLALCYHTGPHHCYACRSLDDGHTWSPIEPLPGLPVWAPRLRTVDGTVMIITGRDIEEKATVAWLSTDSGRTWHDRTILDRPQFEGSYAYTDSLVAEDGVWVFTSSPQSAGRGDIIGLLCALR